MPADRFQGFGEEEYAASVQCALRLWRTVRDPRAGAAERILRPRAGHELRAALGEVLAPALDLGGRWLERSSETWARLERGELAALIDVGVEARGRKLRLDGLVRVERGGRVEIDLVVLREAPGAGEAESDRAAFQLATLRAVDLPLPLGGVRRMELDRRHPRGKGGHAVRWRSRDLGGELALLADEVPERVETAAVVAAGPRPAVLPGPHCRRPQLCPFLAACTDATSGDAVWRLPRLEPGLFAELAALGVERIQDIPDDVRLSPLQARARAAHRTGALHCEAGLRDVLAPLGPPACYLDVEYVVPAVPWFDGMRPYAPIPYQWSIHRVAASGAVEHDAFLAEHPASDPRAAFAAHLLAVLERAPGPVLVYSGAEAEILEALAESHPEHAPGLRAVASRLVDLQALLVRHVYHPGFGGSFGLKRVVAALGRRDPYADLAGVSDGAAAADALWELARDPVAPARRGALRQALLRYCQSDTRALIELHAALCAEGT